MAKFSIQHTDALPGHVFAMVDDRYDVAIIRTESGLTLEVYPVSDGEVWCEPIATFEVDDAQITELETQKEESP